MIPVCKSCGQSIFNHTKPLGTYCPADQLRQAKVEVLREAADELVARGYYMSKRYQAELHRMADEIERSKT